MQKLPRFMPLCWQGFTASQLGGMASSQANAVTSQQQNALSASQKAALQGAGADDKATGSGAGKSMKPQLSLSLTVVPVSQGNVYSICVTDSGASNS